MKQSPLGRWLVRIFILGVIVSMVLLYFLPAIQSAQQ